MMNPTLWIWIVACLHVAFAVAEVFFWETLTPILKVVKTAEEARVTSKVGRNVGVYNGIVAACFLWMLITDPSLERFHSLAILLLVCVIVAGVFGGITIKWSIPIVQALPAAIALVLIHTA
jgi:putative membrane protein